MRDITYRDLLDFVKLNRKGNAFKDCDDDLICIGIKNAVDKGTYLVAVNHGLQICGLAIGSIEGDELYVHEMLATEKWVLPFFIRRFKMLWPDCKLTAMRRMKYVSYNTPKLCNKILKGNI